MLKKSLTIITILLSLVSYTKAQILDDEDYNNVEDLEKQKDRYYNEVYNYAIKHNDSTLLAEAYYLKAKKAQETNIAKSCEYILKGIQAIKDKGASFELGRLYIFLSFNYGILGMKEKSDSYRTKAIQTFILCDSERARVQYANLFNDFEDPVIQERLYQQSEDRNLEILLRISTIYKNKGDYPKAQRFTEKALELALKRPNNGFIENLTRISLGSLLLKQNKVSEAYEQLQIINSLKYATYDKSRVFYESYLGFLINYYEQINDLEKVLFYTKELHQKQLDKLTIDNLQELNKLEIEYQTSIKEEEIKSKQREVKLLHNTLNKQKTLTILGLLLAMGLGAVSIYFFKLNAINKRVSKRNRTLLNEQNHRVKNNLQFIASLLNLQKNYLEEERTKDTIDDILGRIESMSILQRHLYDNGSPETTDLGEYLEQVIEQTIENQCSEDVNTMLELDSVEVKADICLPIGIIINELCTNSCKYAFKDNPQLAVKLVQLANVINIEYNDFGSGLNQDKFQNSTTGFGTQLIKMQLEQIKGQMIFIKENNLQINIPNSP